MNLDPGQTLYVYGFIPASAGGAASLDSPGVDGGPAPFFHCHGSLGAILSLARLEEFCGPEAERRLQDLAWVGPRACRHQAVLEEAMQRGPVFPARFGTLFAALASLEAFLAQHEAAIAGFLDRVAGHEEWAVKGLLNRIQAEEQWLAAKRGKPAAASPGMAYLLEQRLRRQAREELDDWLAQTCDGIARKLQHLAADFRPRRVLDTAADGDGVQPVVNWAFLVPAPAVAAFRSEVERADAALAGQGLSFRSSGPWPPASFCPPLGSP